MRIDPAIAQLRRDPAPQLRAQAALERVRDRWRGQPQMAAISTELERYGGGADFADCPTLGAIFAEPELARRAIDALVVPMVRTLAAHPLGHVPLRHQFAAGLMVLQLASVGRAALSLVCYEDMGQAAARTVCFAGGERRELCLAGAADARFFEIIRAEPQRADLDCEARRIVAGDVLLFEGPRHTKIVDRPRRRMVMFRLSRSETCPSPAREYRIADGALVHCASGDRSESRDAMAAAVLGAMRRHDAAPVLARIARDSGSDHFRWQALRETLALDTAQGFAALTDIAGDTADPLAPPAGALRASLVERHPALAAWMVPCPSS